MKFLFFEENMDTCRLFHYFQKSLISCYLQTVLRYLYVKKEDLTDYRQIFFF